VEGNAGIIGENAFGDNGSNGASNAGAGEREENDMSVLEVVEGNLEVVEGAMEFLEKSNVVLSDNVENEVQLSGTTERRAEEKGTKESLRIVGDKGNRREKDTE
jgi:hypothetical protein